MSGKSQPPPMIRQSPPVELNMPIGEAMFSQRAIRRLDPSRPIADNHIKMMLDAASKAPSGANTQPARYIVLKEREQVRAFGKLYRCAWWAKRQDDYGWRGREDMPKDSFYKMPALLADEMENAPAIILVLSLPTPVAASSTFPGVQNLLLAARALGIGSVLTTLHPTVIDDVYALCDIPKDVQFQCCIPLGYPRGNFGPTSRIPTTETTYWGKWNQRPPESFSA